MTSWRRKSEKSIPFRIHALSSALQGDSRLSDRADLLVALVCITRLDGDTMRALQHLAFKRSSLLKNAGCHFARTASMSSFSCDPLVPLPIDVSADPSGIPARTIPVAFRESCAKHKEVTALVGADGKSFTFAQYLGEVENFARALLHPEISLQAGRGVCVLSCNKPEWHIAAYGSIFAGGIQCGIYANGSNEAQVGHLLALTKAEVVVVDEEAQLAKVLGAVNSGKVPSLKAVVLTYQRAPEKAGAGVKIFSWEAFMALGKEASLNQELEKRLQAQQPGSGCTVIATSGTTGNSKGCLLSHDALLFTLTAFNQAAVDAKPGRELISFLPLSHIASQLADIHGPAMLGITVHSARPDALKGSLVETLRRVKPHYFLGVPRVYEKMHEKVVAATASAPTWRQRLSAWAKELGAKAAEAELQMPHGADHYASSAEQAAMLHHHDKKRHQENKAAVVVTEPFLWPFVRDTLLAVLRKALGFDRVLRFGCGAAPLAPSTLAWFSSVGIVIRETYGLSESSGPHTANIVGRGGTVFGTVGRPLTAASGSMRVAIDNPHPVTGEGEICLAGRNIMNGYLYAQEATEEAFKPLGKKALVWPAMLAGKEANALRWLHTGDLGKIDARGFLRITGRLKEILVTAGGENVAPIPIEDSIKAELDSLVSSVCAIGDKRKFVAALITLRTTVTDKPPAGIVVAASGPSSSDLGWPSDNLEPSAVSYLRTHLGVTGVTTASEAAKHPAVVAALQKAVDAANSRAVSNAAKVQKWAVVSPDFSIAGGELTPTLKLKRKVVTERHAATIESLYR